MKRKNKNKIQKHLRAMETLEDRQVMAAQPLAGFLGGSISHHAIADLPTQGNLGPSIGHHLHETPDFTQRFVDDLPPPAAAGGDFSHHLSSAHGQTGLIQVRNDYGFIGSGQTVAIIDSGIEYNHYALGGGFGQGFRVVGGYDFTGEDDADPQDDGPAGSHGTHVAGIVGADTGSPDTSGVAPGVDFVGLRVFDDVGDGYFSWVENSLQWIYSNRNSFENPITTVNLSLGTDYNSDEPPQWSMLEDEFALLESVGIFIAVSAGNSFTEFNEPGLSYPAASPHVVPVMSVDDDGSLSYFSQRHDRAIAAPGRWINSTVPDYIGNENGIADDWANYSGTSMASPYLAGASVVIREAMEFVGMADITQDTIYDHIRNTADIFYDTATSANYHRLNLEAAIDALMPNDDIGSTAGAAHSLGTLAGGENFSGLIGTLSDADYYTFTAGSSGTLHLTASASHNLEIAWNAVGGGGSVNGNTFSLDVSAGQQYTISLETDDGIGFYDVDVDLDESFDPIDWGSGYFREHDNVSNANGEAWYQFAAGQEGIVTFEAFFEDAQGDVDLRLYNANMEMLDSSTGTGDMSRVEAAGVANEMFYLRVTGTNDSIDFRISNLVTNAGGVISVDGTDGNDTFAIELGSVLQINVNGVEHSLAAAGVTSLQVYGMAGSDEIELTGTSADEEATLTVHNFTHTGSGLTATGESLESITIDSGGGSDIATLHDSQGDDLYRAYADKAIMSGAGFYNRVRDFGTTYGRASSGNDEARLYDSPDDDLFRAYNDRAMMQGTGFYNFAGNFDTVRGMSTSGGNDAARLYDSAADEVYKSYTDRAVMYGVGYYNIAEGFFATYGYSAGGFDIAMMYDSSGADLFKSFANRVVMTGSGFFNEAQGFDEAWGYGSGGNDEAHMYDSAGDDIYRTWEGTAIMMTDVSYNRAEGFATTRGYATAGGYDEARMYDSPDDDLFRAYHDKVIMQGDDYYNRAEGFEIHRGFSDNGGNDEARMYGHAGDDLFRVWSDRAVMMGGGMYNRAEGFDFVRGWGNGGNDESRLYDTIANDLAIARLWGASMQSANFRGDAYDFAIVTAYGVNGGTNTSDIDSVDYAFGLSGAWD